jgi:membrane protein
LLSVGFFLTLYFASNGVSSIIEGFNQTYHTIETRSFVRQQIVSIALVLILAILHIIAISFITIGPIIINWLDVQGFIKGRYTYKVIAITKWLIIIFMFLLMYSFL